MYNLDDYDYELPESLIANTPSEERDASRLLCLDRKTGAVSHNRFFDIEEFLTPGDILVVNNTKVIPGRLFGRKETGGRVELLILNYAEAIRKRNGNAGRCSVKALIKATKRPSFGSFLHFSDSLSAKVLSFDDGIYNVELISDGDIESVIHEIGHVPLPPYIRRKENEKKVDDTESYQTVYARENGAIAAPTAGLHFTDHLLRRLALKGVVVAPITLHVGYGTFVPVREKDIRNHLMHEEYFHLDRKVAAAINHGKYNGKKVIAVGTTSVRTLEYQTDENGCLREGEGHCNLFIYPGYRFRMVDGIITNFHLPQSTLLMLVSAFAGLPLILNAYQTAISMRYRFYSYGDAMFIYGRDLDSGEK